MSLWVVFSVDPQTIKFLKNNIDPVFGFPKLVRFSWSTAQKILDENAAQVDWSVINKFNSKCLNKVSVPYFKLYWFSFTNCCTTIIQFDEI